jgi:hypothetical protein
MIYGNYSLLSQDIIIKYSKIKNYIFPQDIFKSQVDYKSPTAITLYSTTATAVTARHRHIAFSHTGCHRHHTAIIGYRYHYFTSRARYRYSHQYHISGYSSISRSRVQDHCSGYQDQEFTSR